MPRSSWHINISWCIVDLDDPLSNDFGSIRSLRFCFLISCHPFQISVWKKCLANKHFTCIQNTAAMPARLSNNSKMELDVRWSKVNNIYVKVTAKSTGFILV